MPRPAPPKATTVTALCLAAFVVVFLLTEVLYALFLGAPRHSSGRPPTLLEHLLVALPLSLPLGLAGVGMAFSLRRHGWWALVPVALVAPFVVGAVAWKLAWLQEAGAHVTAAAHTALRENGFFLARWMWNAVDGFVVIFLLPVLLVLWVIDLVFLPFVILLTPIFLAQVSIFVAKCGLLAGLGVMASLVVSVPLLVFMERRHAGGAASAR
jgi:hypothetical protein